MWRSWRFIWDDKIRQTNSRAVWYELGYSNPLEHFKVVLKRSYTIPEKQDLQLLIEFHKKHAKSPLLPRESIEELLFDEKLTIKQNHLMLIWFQEVWGFSIHSTETIFQCLSDPNAEIEINLILISCLSFFYDIKITQLHKIQLNLVYNHGDYIWFKSWNGKLWLVFPTIFKPIILRIIKQSPKCLKCQVRICTHGKNWLMTRSFVKEKIEEYLEIDLNYSHSVKENKKSL